MVDSFDLLKIAENARKNSVCKYSNYAVGAALITKSNTVYIGTNIEEPVIPGLSNCAERVALQNALSHGERQFEAIAIVGGYVGKKLDLNITPCGVCRQYILDTCKDIKIITYGEDGNPVIKKIDYYLQDSFKLEK